MANLQGKKQITEEKCDLCYQGPRRSKHSMICDTCYFGIERFFLLYFTRYDLRSRLPDDIRRMLLDVVIAISNSYEMTADEFKNIDKLTAVIRASQGRPVKATKKVFGAKA